MRQHTTHLIEKYEQLSMNYEQHTALLIEKYEQLLANNEKLRQMIMNITSQKDDTCASPFWSYGPRNNQPSPPPPSPAPPLF